MADRPGRVIRLLTASRSTVLSSTCNFNCTSYLAATFQTVLIMIVTNSQFRRFIDIFHLQLLFVVNRLNGVMRAMHM